MIMPVFGAKNVKSEDVNQEGGVRGGARRYMNGVSVTAALLLFIAAIPFIDRGPRPAAVALLVLAMLALFSIKIANQWEKAVVLRFGKFRALRGPGLFGPLRERVDEVLDRDPQRFSIGDETVHEILQGLALLARLRAGARGNERPRALLRLHDPPDLHLAIGLGDGVEIHREVDRELANRRELRPRLQAPVADGEQDLIDDLPVERHSRRRVQAEEMLCRCHRLLVQ